MQSYDVFRQKTINIMFFVSTTCGGYTIFATIMAGHAISAATTTKKRKSDGFLFNVTALGNKVWMKLKLLDAVIARCDTHELVEGTIKALTVGEAHHIAHFLHT